jgi:hypothetical protein
VAYEAGGGKSLSNTSFTGRSAPRLSMGITLSEWPRGSRAAWRYGVARYGHRDVAVMAMRATPRTHARRVLAEVESLHVALAAFGHGDTGIATPPRWQKPFPRGSEAS